MPETALAERATILHCLNTITGLKDYQDYSLLSQSLILPIFVIFGIVFKQALGMRGYFQ